MKNNTPSNFSNNLIQIININSNNISHVASPYKVPSQSDHYIDLMLKIDRIIIDSRKTQEFILEKQFSKQNTIIKSDIPKEIQYKILKVLKETSIPASFQTPLINNHVLSHIIQNNLLKPESKPFKNSSETFIDPLKSKIELIHSKTGFNMVNLIDDLYELAQNSLLEESPIRKSLIKGKLFKIGLEGCKLNIKEDLSWKELKGEEKTLFYKENLIENIESNDLTKQLMEINYKRLLCVFLKSKC